MPCCLLGVDGNRTKCTVNIVNETICTFKRVNQRSQQMDRWEEEFPDVIKPASKVAVPVSFCTKSSEKYWLDHGEVTYEAFDNADLSLAKFTITATAQESEQGCFCPTFKGHIAVNWDTLPKVFGIVVAPRDGQLFFKRGGSVELTIKGNVLHGGLRITEDGKIKLTDWMTWQELQPLCEPGDVLGVDRGAFRHYGVVQRIEPDGTVVVSHLIGTAGGLLKAHGVAGVKEVFNAVTGSHGDIAGVETQPLELFAAKDKCRVENLHDDRWKPYMADVLMRRIMQATGFRDYSLFEFNCEHYANLIRYGMPYSAQIEEIKRKFDIAERSKNFYQESSVKVKQEVTHSANVAVTAIKSEWTNVTHNVSEKTTHLFSKKTEKTEKIEVVKETTKL